jgi:murein DD-endopeptidase MepM/ murein hydrolase activator NlpD
VDIPAYQGTPIQAAADGVVYTARDNGYGYNYIILAHADGFMSVYGHVSEIMVQEGETVPQGGIIAMSGGMPGTKGAGYMTTGPHLHFEVLKNGTYTDPLDYLSLDVLTREQVEGQLPEKYWDKWENDSFKAAFKEDDFELESGYERVR